MNEESTISGFKTSKMSNIHHSPTSSDVDALATVIDVFPAPQISLESAKMVTAPPQTVVTNFLV
jgi:hypothetical protein